MLGYRTRDDIDDDYDDYDDNNNNNIKLKSINRELHHECPQITSN
jgi:hypothetical protein